MATPVFAITGFLDAGKTTFLNELLNRNDWRAYRFLVVQFELGETEFVNRHGNCTILRFSKKMLEQQFDQIREQIHTSIRKIEPDEIWVEWNCMAPFAQLQALFLHPSLKEVCNIHKVAHMANAESIEQLLGRTGSTLPDQIANSDMVVLRNAPSRSARLHVQRLLRSLNPGVKVFSNEAQQYLTRQLFQKNAHNFDIFAIAIICLVFLHFAAKPLLESVGIPINAIIVVFLGIILQAIPFLLIGVLLSSAISVFVPQRFIERRFPKSIGLGMLMAIFAGFCLPVCDCASVPIFRGFIRKGIPLPVAVTFLVATPIINPIVILSTYYAFSGNSTIVIGRVCLGIIAALLIGVSFAIRPPKREVLSGGAMDRIFCSCGCFEGADSLSTFQEKLALFVRHSQAEFFNVGKYLIVGTFISALFQTVGASLFSPTNSGTGLAISIAVMMAMAFALSLCSSSDAVIGRSFATLFPSGAIMGFLIFGPIMDIKNVLMLSSSFSKHFILRLLATTFFICFSLVFLLSSIGVL